jgi:hypothetical protein
VVSVDTETVHTDAVDSASDRRTVNNTMRHQYRVLSDAEKASMVAIKDMGAALHQLVAGLGKAQDDRDLASPGLSDN